MANQTTETTEATEKVEKAEKKSPRRFFLPAFFALLIIIGGYFGIKQYIYSLHHEDTDDAQVDGDIGPVVARVTGYVNDILFAENQEVNKGQVLVKLDDRDLQIKVTQAEAALENAQANVNVAKANVSTYDANLQTALSNLDAAKTKQSKANDDFKRYQALIKDKAVTQQQFDDIKSTKDNADVQVLVAQKQVDAAKTQMSASQSQITVAQSVVSQKQSDLDYAKLQLSYATITAPFSGTASKKNIEPGQLVQAGQALFSVVSDSGIYVTGNFKETQLVDMKVGQKAEVEVDAFPDEKIEGTVQSFSGASGARFSLLPPDNASGNYVKVVQRVPVKIKLNLTKEQAAKLRPGMSVKIAVNVS